MSRLLRTALALGAVFFALVALSACGDSVPSSDVVKVDNTTIAKTTFAHWLAVSAKSQQQQAGAAATLPDAPDFTKCIAAAKAAAPTPVKGQPKQTDAQFKATCKQQYNQQRDQVMTFLIRSQWLEAEASKQGIKVTDAEVKAAFDKARKQAFPKTADYVKFLKTSGQTQADLLYRQRTQLLEQKITAKITKNAATVTDKDIQAYYDKNKKQFTTPETRNLSVVLTKDQATAAKAKAAIDSGQSWASVAKKYSIDPAAKDNGGTLSNVTKGQGSPVFDKAVFSASKGAITGPVKTADGWYVFRVDSVKPEKVTPLNAATKAQLKSTVAQTKQQTALTTFGKEYTDRWKGKTDCQKGFVVTDCSNSKAKPASTVPPGAVPQTQQQTAPSNSATTTAPSTGG